MAKLVNPKKYLVICFTTIICLMFCINVTFSFFRYSYYQWIPFIIDIFGILIYSMKYKKIGIKKLYYVMIKEFFLPFLIPSIIAAITAVLIYHNSRYTMSSFKYVLWAYGAYLLGYFLVVKFRIHAFYLFLCAGTISYITVIFRTIILKIPGVSLEVHELTYLYGVMFVFFATYSKISKNQRFFSCLICVCGIILGNKRVLWLSLTIALSVYILFHHILHKKIKGLRFCAIISLIVGFCWIYIIKNGFFEQICYMFNINDMSRLKMWNFFKEDYDISPLYWGRGLTYTDVVMSIVHLSQLHISNPIPIHNFVLKAFIGWGFWPFLYHFFNFLYFRIINIAKNGRQENAWILLSVTLVIYINNFFGDTMLNIGTCILYGMIWSLFRLENDR